MIHKIPRCLRRVQAGFLDRMKFNSKPPFPFLQIKDEEALHFFILVLGVKGVGFLICHLFCRRLQFLGVLSCLSDRRHAFHELLRTSVWEAIESFVPNKQQRIATTQQATSKTCTTKVWLLVFSTVQFPPFYFLHNPVFLSWIRLFFHH